MGFSDLRQNIKLFLGTFLAITVRSCIICSCLNLVFSAVATFDYGKRFSAVDVSVISNQNVCISYTDEDGDMEVDKKNVAGRIPISEEQLRILENEYEIIPDYSFFIRISDLDA